MAPRKKTAEENAEVKEEKKPRGRKKKEETPVAEPVDTAAILQTEDDLTPEEIEFLEYQKKFNAEAGKVIKASNKNWSELNREEHIVTLDGQLSVETDKTLIKKDLMELTRSVSAKTILEGTIVGVRCANSNSSLPTMLAEVEYGSGLCTVLIPSYALIAYNISKYKDPSAQSKIASAMNAMVGSPVRFIVRQVDKNNKTAIADRLAAMEVDGTVNYIRISNGRPRVTTGMLVEGTIVRRGRDYLVVHALGSDSTIYTAARDGKIGEVSWNFIEDCREEFKNGDKVVARVLSVARTAHEAYSNRYRLVKAELSIKQTTPNPVEKYYDTVTENAVYKATVQAVTDAGVFVNIKGQVPCLCAFPKRGKLPEHGDEITIRVTEKVEGDFGKRIFGIITL